MHPLHRYSTGTSRSPLDGLLPANIWCNHAPSPLKFIIIGLAAFAEMKSQGSEFPFKTHPRSMNVAVTSLLFYGLASAAEHFISATRLGPASVYAMVAHLGRIGSLFILVASVTSLFYI
ncbi:hypothetical protein L2E82_47693 [Cichorium intybus]|uniref:Uncharacterized protein n=1 Tax=Cichorium intybus TaxID=13427 RepID=A0ACB8YWR5_CICIN|nr:hypothetical protein L2E82_47693 [Cichorium intybus]